MIARPLVACVGGAALLALLVAACDNGEHDCRETEPPPPVAGSSLAADEPLARLVAGEAIEFDVAPGSFRRFRLQAAAGDFVRLIVEQDEIDVITRLLDPSRKLLADVDRIFADSGSEPLLAVIERDGEHTVEIEAFERSGRPGRIGLRMAALRSAEETDLEAAERFRTLRQADACAAKADRLRGSIAVYQQVIDSSAEAGDGDLWSEAMVRLARAHRLLRDVEPARSLLRQVVAAKGLGEPIWQTLALETLAFLDINDGQATTAVRFAEAGLAKPEVEKFPFRRAKLYFLLGRARQMQGAIQHALDAYRQAQALFRPWDEINRADVQQNLGALHRHNLGQPEAALELFRQSEKTYREQGDRKSLASALNQIGACLEETGDIDAAADSYGKALEIRRELEDGCGEANTLIRLALLDLDAGRDRQADNEAAAARAIDDSERCVHDRQAIRLRLGLFAEQKGDLDTARDDYDRSRADADAADNRAVELEALVGLARSCRLPGACSDDPLTLTSEALEIVDDTRSDLAQEDHRLAFGSRTQALFDLRIDLQWQRREFSAALETAEKARARALLDRLRQIDADIGSGAASEIVEEAKQLRYELSEKEQQRLESEYQGGLSDDKRASQRREVDALVARLNEVEAEIGRQHSEYFQLMRAEPAGLAEVRGLLDPQTALLVYRLGEAHSFLWVLTESESDDVSFELASGAEIETAAQAGLGYLKSLRPGVWSPSELVSLAELILPAAAVQSLTGRRRWMIVADGALELLPFAALPDPAHEAQQPLVVGHEIVNLPSASAWVELRSRSELPEPPRMLAIMADPAYEEFASLPGSGIEATAILDLLPEDAQATSLLGSQATREEVLLGHLRGHRVVHLAVHGEIHPRQPALSYLAFAERGVGGDKLESELFAYEVYNLDLPAELVVLAGCETGIGPLIPGEGLVSGLSRSFLYAGAQQVMVSLWPILDSKTPELMVQFYSRFFAGADPVMALHDAQRALYEADASPHTWAGFVLQGD